MKKYILMVFVISLIYVMVFHQPFSSYSAIQKIKITSTDFSNKGFIPDDHACEFLGADKSPQFSFSNAPSDTQSFALIMFDPDAPGKNFVHWIIFNIPVSSNDLEQGIPRNATLENGTKQGINSTEQIGYFGPCPPPKETHRYVFKVFALNKILALDSSATKKELVKAMKGYIVGKGLLVGLYKNKTNN